MSNFPSNKIGGSTRVRPGVEYAGMGSTECIHCNPVRVRATKTVTWLTTDEEPWNTVELVLCDRHAAPYEAE